MKQIRKRLTYANVMSTIAVFVAIGGASAFAATELAKNSVGSKQLKSSAVTAAKIKKEAITEAKIQNGAVTSAKLRDGSVIAGKVGTNAVATANVADNAITTGKITDSAVTTGKLADAGVTTSKLAEVGVTTGKIANEAVSAAKMTKSPFQLGSAVNAAATSVSSVEIECAAGTKLLSGGVLNSNKELKVIGTYPNTETKWKIVVYNESAGVIAYTPIVLCLK